MRERNNQKQAWVDMNLLLKIRKLKRIKSNGKPETDAEVFERIFNKALQKMDSDISKELKIKFDKNNFFK